VCVLARHDAEAWARGLFAVMLAQIVRLLRPDSEAQFWTMRTRSSCWSGRSTPLAWVRAAS